MSCLLYCIHNSWSRILARESAELLQFRDFRSLYNSTNQPMSCAVLSTTSSVLKPALAGSNSNIALAPSVRHSFCSAAFGITVQCGNLDSRTREERPSTADGHRHGFLLFQCTRSSAANRACPECTPNIRYLAHSLLFISYILILLVARILLDDSNVHRHSTNHTSCPGCQGGET
jgi:hypothetical protein